MPPVTSLSLQANFVNRFMKDSNKPIDCQLINTKAWSYVFQPTMAHKQSYIF